MGMDFYFSLPYLRCGFEAVVNFYGGWSVF